MVTTLTTMSGKQLKDKLGVHRFYVLLNSDMESIMKEEYMSLEIGKNELSEEIDDYYDGSGFILSTIYDLPQWLQDIPNEEIDSIGVLSIDSDCECKYFEHKDKFGNIYEHNYKSNSVNLLHVVKLNKFIKENSYVLNRIKTK